MPPSMIISKLTYETTCLNYWKSTILKAPNYDGILNSFLNQNPTLNKYLAKPIEFKLLNINLLNL